jgi:hypothetical protein
MLGVLVVEGVQEWDKVGILDVFDLARICF